MKISLSKKSILLALFIAAIGMVLNVPFRVCGARPNSSENAKAAPTEHNDEKKIKSAFDKLPLYFIESPQGEDRQAGYYVQGKDKSLFFTSQGISVALENAPVIASDNKAERIAKMKESGEAEE